ncbi:hypothetical protein PIB30_071375 [Stylosanthes scabra]|uniref:Uncharacterized protein n=1 Tax=Stylosanthes scabra TaxID=79078 RepID=A0ABU6VR81_9FABA|nr:hypothetical protein [Stylosanthes scabra]
MMEGTYSYDQGYTPWNPPPYQHHAPQYNVYQSIGFGDAYYGYKDPPPPYQPSQGNFKNIFQVLLQKSKEFWETQRRLEAQLATVIEIVTRLVTLSVASNSNTFHPSNFGDVENLNHKEMHECLEEVEEEPEKEVDDEVLEEETKGETFFIATIFRGNEVKEIEMPVKCEDPSPRLVTINKGGRPQVLLGRPFLKTVRFKLQYDDDTFSLSVGKNTEVFHVTPPLAPRKKGSHQLRVGSKKIEPEKLLRSEERKESDNLKNDGFIGKGLRIAPPQLKKKRKKVPLNLEKKKEKKKKKQEEGKSEKKMVLQCSSFAKLLGKLRIFKKILHHHKNMEAHLVKDNSKWK